MASLTQQLDRLKKASLATPQATAKYRYCALEQNVFRLLRVLTPSNEQQCALPDAGDHIHCALETFNIESAPTYHALSYTWGATTAIFTSKTQVAHAESYQNREYAVSVDGTLIRVGESLFEALFQLRHQRRQRADFVGLHDEEDKAWYEFKFIWIDAICINQECSRERSQQVALMHNIYSNAHTVFVWLGLSDAFAHIAMDLLPEMRKSNANEKADLFRSSGISLNLRDSTLIGLPKLETYHWLALYAFFQRFWFRRAWIVQEITLARHAVVLCGSRILDLGTVIQGAMFLDQSGVYHELRSYVYNISQGKSPYRIDNMIRGERSEEPTEFLFEVGQDLSFSSVRTIREFAQVRAALGLDTSGFQRSTRLSRNDLLTLLVRFRRTSCRDPRDKVFSILGVLAKDRQCDIRSLPVTVDYGSSVATVYTETAWAILRSMSNLGLLSYAKYRSKIAGLPSWVPDWHAPQVNSLYGVGWAEGTFHQLPWNASNNTEWTENQLASFWNLSVRGQFVGKCHDIVVYKYDIWSIIHLLTIMPRILAIPGGSKSAANAPIHPQQGTKTSQSQPPLDARRKEFTKMDQDSLHVRSTAIIIGPIEKFKVARIVEVGHHLIASNTLHSQNDFEFREVDPAGDEGERSQKRQRTESEGKLKLDKQTVSCFTRIELLWRTMVHNMWQGQYPAPREAGDFFVEALKLTLLRNFWALTGSRASGNNSGAESREGGLQSQQALLIFALKMLSIVEASDLEILGTLRPADRLKALQRSSLEDGVAETVIQTSTSASWKTRLPLFKSSMDYFMREIPRDVQKQMDMGESWERQAGQVHHSAFFTTEEGLFGTATAGIQRGDELWILEGCPFPIILRQLPNGNYSLISESYVHGLMHGEIDITSPFTNIRDLVIN